jgi:hypothetical protein
MKEKQMLEVHQVAFRAFQAEHELANFEAINTLSAKPFPKV